MMTFGARPASCAFLLTGASRAGAAAYRPCVDVPNHRSSHTALIPRGGGLAVMLAWSCSPAPSSRGRPCSACPWRWRWRSPGWDSSTTSGGLSGAVRLLLQVGGGVVGRSWADGQAPSGSSWPILVSGGDLRIVGYVNAFNFMDGVNAHLGAQRRGRRGWFALARRARRSSPADASSASALAGASLGFLPWNAPRAAGLPR